MILSSNGVGSQQIDHLIGGEASVRHTCENLVGTVEGLRDGQVGGGTSDVRAARLEREARTAFTVGDTNGTGELDTVKQESLA